MIPDLRRAWEALSRRPLVYQLTSAVSAAWQAEVTAAVGAVPVLSRHPAEAREIAAGADGLLLNAGMPGTSSPEAFAEALAGLRRGRPCLVDPVGYGVTAWRREWIDALLRARPLAVKGNRAEVALLGGGEGAMRGVEGGEARGVEGALARLVRSGRATLAVATGAEDLLFFEGRFWTVRGGSPHLPALPGSGCCLGSVMTACLAVAEPLSAALAALVSFRLASARADRAAGPASFRSAFVDALASLDGADLDEGASLVERIRP